MRFGEIIQEIQSLDLYSMEQWKEYLDYFTENEDLRKFLAEQLYENKGCMKKRIESRRGKEPEAPEFSISKKITHPDILGKLQRRKSITLGIVSGAFDILHLGHIRSMIYAKQFISNCPNNKLCVLILSDENIRIKKEESRPILNLNERLDMLSHVSCVDYIIPMRESNCLITLDNLWPDYYFKAGKDKAQKIVLQEIELVESYGGSVIIFPPSTKDAKSTTGIIETVLGRIKN